MSLPSQVTVAYSMHTGYLDKAVKYTEKALAQIEKIRGLFIFFLLYINYYSGHFYSRGRFLISCTYSSNFLQ